MRHEKQIWRILLVLLAVLLVWCGSAAAADRTLTAGPLTGSPVPGNVGDTVSVPISVNDATGIGGIAFTIGYDPQAFTFVNLVEDQKALADGSLYTGGVHDGYTDAQVTSSLFYQANDEKVGGLPTGPSTGRVMVAAATADGLTGADLRLFKAQFTIKAGAAGVYPIQLMGTIITNASAGYNTPTVIPVLVGTSTKDTNPSSPNYGKYTLFDFLPIAAILKNGSISVSISGKAISGKAYYGANTSLPAAGCPVILQKTAASGVGFVYDSQTTVSSTGAFSFANKPAGSYLVSIQSIDPGYVSSLDLPVTMPVVPVDVVVPDVHLAAVAATYEHYTGTVSVYYPGMQLKVYLATDLTTPIGVYPMDSSTWLTGLLEKKTPGYYKFFVEYGKLLKTEVTAGESTPLPWSLKKISGLITGLPADAIVTIMAGSADAGVQKMIRQPVGATGYYEFADLVPATNYIVSMAGAGKPLSYYNGVSPFIPVTDITTATTVDISGANREDVNFPFPTVTLGTVSGKVTEGTPPVSGIAVYASETTTYALTQAITGTDGVYTFKLMTGDYQLFVIKANGKIFYYNETAATQNEADATLIKVPPQVGDNTGKDMNIVECANSLSGKVTFKRESGDPAADILITAFSDANSSKAAAITGPDGRYTLTGLCGPNTYNIIMQPLLGRYAVQKKTAAIPATAALNFIIDSGNVLSGTVKNEVGADVNDAMIYLLDQATGTLINNRVYLSAAGQYNVGDVASGVYTLKGSHIDYSTYTKADLEIRLDTVQPILFTLGARFTGTVTEVVPVVGVKPVRDALVIVTSARPGDVPVSVVTDQNGKYAVYGLDANYHEYRIIVQKKDYLRQATPFDRTPGTAAPSGTVVDFLLEKMSNTFDLTGTVSKSGGAGTVPNVWVMLTAKGGDFFVSTLTNASGVYTFTNLPQADDYRLVVTLGGSLPAYVKSINYWLTASGTVTEDVPIAWGDSTKISGIVTLNPPGTGGGVISVFLYKAADDSFAAFTKAVGDGPYTYEFQGLDAAVTYKVLALSPGYSPRWFKLGTTGTGAIGDASGVSTATINADITLPGE